MIFRAWWVVGGGMDGGVKSSEKAQNLFWLEGSREKKKGPTAKK